MPGTATCGGSTGSTDTTRISWSDSLKLDVAKNRRAAFDAGCLRPSLYRPFTRRWFYFDRRFNERVYQMPKIYPDPSVVNRTICITGAGESKEFSVLMSDSITELKTLYNSQTFPLFLFASAQGACRP